MDLDKRIAEVWGVVRDTPAERAKLIASTKQKLLSPAPPPDPHLGRAVFAKTCAQCHTLFGVGAKIGPDITGANRASLDYLLENILDPSAVIPKEYTATLVELTDGRILTGLVRNETPATITVHTANDTLTIPRGDIAGLKATNVSMMPDDLVSKLTDRELRSLIAYLQSPVQTPLLATAENIKDFFNGKDLAGWDGDAKLWRVDKDEIIGKTDGLKQNEFLKSHMAAGDFKLSLKVKLTPNKENSGVQFRSEVLPGGDVKGLQADIGEGWWGKLYDEHGRGLLWDKSAEKHVKIDDWNDYVIEAQGTRIRTWLNGNLCVDYEDKAGPRRGIFALQLHSGGPMEVRFKDLRLEIQK